MDTENVEKINLKKCSGCKEEKKFWEFSWRVKQGKYDNRCIKCQNACARKQREKMKKSPFNSKYEPADWKQSVTRLMKWL